MRLPSVQYLALGARDAVRRFPLVLAAAAVAAAGGVASTVWQHQPWLVRAMVTAQLGFSFLFSIAVAGESWRWPRVARAALNLAAVLALVAYAATLPDSMRPGAVTRFLQFNVGLHLLAAFVPFAGRGHDNAFWQYNKALFLRFLVSALYSVVVFGGLSVAMLALDKLLGVPVDGDYYLRLWIVVAFVFNTWVFLGGVPRNLLRLEIVQDYPRALKVFAQYILIPLVVVYLAILTAYLVKVVATTQWPSGWIGYLVSSVAVAGILALLLVWPVSERAENRWVATYTRWFFILMMPSIVMLLLAIYQRIDQYGITENRYFLAVLAVWLAGVALYFASVPGRRIKMIPVTLCVIAFATSFGPWGAYTVSRRSQTARLAVLLERNGILEGGTIVRTTAAVPYEDRREISALTRYLVDHHGIETFEPWFGRTRLAEADTLDARSRRNAAAGARLVMTEMGVEYVEAWMSRGTRSGYFQFTMDDRDDVFRLDGADYFARLLPRATPVRLDDRYSLVWDDAVGVTLRDRGAPRLTVSVDSLLARIDAARTAVTDPNRMPRDVMHVRTADAGARLDVYFLTVSGRIEDGEHHVNYMQANCFVTAGAP